MSEGTAPDNKSVTIRALRGVRVALLALQAIALAIVVLASLRGDQGGVLALKSVLKALAWPFGHCLWCSGGETTEGIVFVLAEGGGYLLALFLPLLTYALLGALVRRLARKRGEAAQGPLGMLTSRYAGLKTVTLTALLVGAVLFAIQPTDRTSGQRAQSANASQEAPPQPRDAQGRAAQVGTTYAVQVGVFGEAAHAEKLSAMLTAAGLNAFVTVPTEGRHRVRVGPFGTRQEAEAAAKEVRSLSLPAAVLEL